MNIQFAEHPNNKRFIDMTGQKFNRLVFLGYAGRPSLWYVKCDCGIVKKMVAADVKSGKVVSCGCYRDENTAKRSLKHGHMVGRNVSPEYNIWSAIVQRCTNPKNKQYFNYGGRGIKIYEQWLDFSTFIQDVGCRPDPEYSLDRIDNNRGYEPGNVRWTNITTQANNTRANRMLTYDGKTQSLAVWCRELNLDYDSVKNRLRRGWSADDAFNIPLETMTPRLITHNGKTQSLLAWCKELGLKYQTAHWRLVRGAPIEKVLSR